MQFMKRLLVGACAVVMATAAVDLGVVTAPSTAQAQVHPHPGVRPGGRPGVRPGFRPGGRPGYAYRGGYHRGGRWRGGAGVGAAAAAVGVLGILGAAAAADAASRPAPVYEDDCPLVRRRVYLDDGSYVIRRVPAC